MSSTFLKRFHQIRDDFHGKTKQWPQMRLASDGSEKATGIVDDLKKLDTAIDTPGIDFAALTAAFQSFEKHARTYAQQIDAKPGKGVLEWVAKEKKAELTEKEIKNLEEQSRAFGKQLETLIKDVDSTVKSELGKVTKRKDKVKAFTAVKTDAVTWGKYLEDTGLVIITDEKVAQKVPNPKTQQPSQLAITSGENAKQYMGAMRDVCGRIAKVDTSAFLSSKMNENLKLMTALATDVHMIAGKLVEFLHTWRIEIEQILKDYVSKGNKHQAHDIMLGLMAKVEESKQRFQKLELKCQAAKKVTEALQKD